MADKKDRSRIVVRFPPAEFDRLSETLERFGGVQFVGERLFRWFEEQDANVQGMVLRQQVPADDLVQLVMNRLRSGSYGAPTAKAARTDPQGGRGPTGEKKR